MEIVEEQQQEEAHVGGGGKVGWKGGKGGVGGERKVKSRVKELVNVGFAALERRAEDKSRRAL